MRLWTLPEELDSARIEDPRSAIRGTGQTPNKERLARFEMPDFDQHVRQVLIERIRGIFNENRTIDCGDDAPVACSCGAFGLSDHPRHVAEQIVDGLDLRVDAIDHIKKRIRHASAWFDWELTQLEGAEF